VNKQDAASLFDVAGKTAIVTGATGVIGLAAAKILAAGGANVMLTGRSEDKCAVCAEQIVQDGGRAAYAAGDPASHEDVTRVVAKTVEQFGGVDILVTAAGVSVPGAITEQSDEVWQSVIDANLNGTYYFCKEVIKAMLEKGRDPEKGNGKIIMIGSVRGELGYPNYSAYCPSKGAVHLLTKALACEVAPKGINVNCIAPAFTITPLTQWVLEDEAVYKSAIARIPLGRPGGPEDFYGAFLFLASKGSDWITGHILHVDGGYLAL
jgi:NAD(P)-dependent dehydrogenase (short-subunit alcohol dehydrogenase family)